MTAACFEQPPVPGDGAAASGIDSCALDVLVIFLGEAARMLLTDTGIRVV